MREYDSVTGALIRVPASVASPAVALLPSGEILVTCMGTDLVYRYSPTFTLLGSFGSPGWINPHGIAINPNDGRIDVVEGVAGRVHVFDPVTFAELTPTFLAPAPGDKIVDLDFQPATGPTPVTSTSWGRIKRLYR